MSDNYVYNWLVGEIHKKDFKFVSDSIVDSTTLRRDAKIVSSFTSPMGRKFATSTINNFQDTVINNDEKIDFFAMVRSGTLKENQYKIQKMKEYRRQVLESELNWRRKKAKKFPNLNLNFKY